MCAEKALKNQIKSENSDKVHQNQGFFKAYKSSAVGGTNEIDENRSQFKAGNLKWRTDADIFANFNSSEGGKQIR